MQGYIYVALEVDTDNIKIGHTTRENVMVRIKELQTGNSSEIKLLHTFPGSLRDEKNLHEALDVFRVSGEWFDVNLGKLIEAISYTRQQLLQSPPDHSEGEAVMVGEYCNVKVVSGPYEGLEGFYSGDTLQEVWHFDPHYAGLLTDDDQEESGKFHAAEVYILDDGAVVLPYESLVRT